MPPTCETVWPLNTRCPPASCFFLFSVIYSAERRLCPWEFVHPVRRCKAVSVLLLKPHTVLSFPNRVVFRLPNSDKNPPPPHTFRYTLCKTPSVSTNNPTCPSARCLKKLGESSPSRATTASTPTAAVLLATILQYLHSIRRYSALGLGYY